MYDYNLSKLMVKVAFCVITAALICGVSIGIAVEKWLL